ncbi:MAG: type I methionyl aminopeptidase [Patescibacteria group bacterium]
MSLIKTTEEIEKLRQGGAILSHTLRKVREMCVPGVTSEQLDALARKQLAEAGATPSFLGYQISKHDPKYPGALCVSVNDEVVHGLPVPARLIKEGDVVGLDIGAWYEGLCTDMATTVIAGKPRHAREEALVMDTREALVRAISVVRDGALVGDIGAAVEDYLTPKRYGIVRDLVGHGVGHAVHEDPSIPNFRDPRTAGFVLRTGMVIAIEPMVALGSWHVYQKRDGWTIATEDRSPVAHFELTIAVTETGYELLTPWPDEPLDS